MFEYKIGNTVIKICTDNCSQKSAEDVREILKKCADIVYYSPSQKA